MKGTREKVLVLWSLKPERWAEALADARAHLSVTKASFRQFVPLEHVRSWVADTLWGSVVQAEAAVLAAGQQRRREQAAAGFRAVALFLRAAQRVRLYCALLAMRRRVVLARTQEGLAGRLHSWATRRSGRAVLVEYFSCWRRAVHPPARNASRACGHVPAAEALAHALVEGWRPFWAQRAALLCWALRPALRLALQAPLLRLREAAEHRRARGDAIPTVVLARGLTPVDAVSAACCQCLVVVLRHCIQRRLGAVWRELACAGARLGLAEALDVLQPQLEEDTEETVMRYESAARLHGARRIGGALRHARARSLRGVLFQLEEGSKGQGPRLEPQVDAGDGQAVGHKRRSRSFSFNPPDWSRFNPEREW